MAMIWKKTTERQETLPLEGQFMMLVMGMAFKIIFDK